MTSDIWNISDITKYVRLERLSPYVFLFETYASTGLEKLRAHLCPSTYGVCKSSRT